MEKPNVFQHLKGFSVAFLGRGWQEGPLTCTVKVERRSVCAITRWAQTGLQTTWSFFR